jgi:UDP-3-O-[3-hydroxymyristoyl] glucosamine N-acyltransferase
MSTATTLGELANRFGLDLEGDPATVVRGVSTLAAANDDQIGFLANPAYRHQLPVTQAAAVVLRAADRDIAPGAVLVSRNPYADFARIAALFEPAVPHPPGIHESAVIDPTAVIEEGVSIGPFVSIGPRTHLGRGSSIGPGCIVGEDCAVGESSVLVARVTLVRRVRIGRRVLVHPGAVLGADGFGIAMDQGTWVKVPQLGGVVIGDDCEIGANTTIDRAALGDTILEEDVRLDNQIQIGHNVVIGAHTAIAGCAAIAGSARIGRWCLIGGGAGVVGHIEICDRVTINAMSLVSHTIREPGTYASGTALQENDLWRRNAARLRRLDDFVRRVNARLSPKDEP